MAEQETAEWEKARKEKKNRQRPLKYMIEQFNRNIERAEELKEYFEGNLNKINNFQLFYKKIFQRIWTR